MIDEKKLLEKLNVWYESLSPRTDIQDSIKCDVIDNVITIIEGAEKVNEWIPVSERLPDVDEYILVSFENFSTPMIGRYTVDDDDGGTFRVGDEDDSFVQHDLYVNAWQPLPEPYREESAE